MADKNSDDFDKIAKGYGKNDKKGEYPVPQTFWDAIQLFWPNIIGEGFPVKGLFLIQCVGESGEPEFIFHNSEMFPDWEVKGMLTHALDLLRDEQTMRGVGYMVHRVMNEDDDDGDDDDE